MAVLERKLLSVTEEKEDTLLPPGEVTAWSLVMTSESPPLGEE